MFRILRLSSVLLIVVAAPMMQTPAAGQTEVALQELVVNQKKKTPFDVPDNLVTLEMIEDALDMPCPNMQFSGQHPLSDLLEVFEAHWSKHVPYDVPLFVDRVEFDIEDVNSLDDFSVSDIKIAGGTHTCRDAMDLVLGQAVDPELAFPPECWPHSSDDAGESRIGGDFVFSRL